MAVKPDFAITDQNASAVASVCLRLDGIPLAIELAAARVRSLTVEQIHAQLNNRFRLLTGGSRTALPRQQTLRAMIDWSYDLLEPNQKALLCRLSVFAGGWTLEAAEEVCSVDALSAPNSGGTIEECEVLDLLTALVDKSLVLVDDQGEAVRYRLLETVRQYARDRLMESGDSDTVRERHLDHFLAFAEEAEPKLEGPDQVDWLARLELEHDNFRAALEWCNGEAGTAEAGLRLVGALGPFWSVHGHINAGRIYLAEALEHVGGANRTQARAKALSTAGNLAWLQNDYNAARALGEEGLAINREFGNKRGIAMSLNRLGHVASDTGSATTLYKQSLAIFRELGDRWGIALTLMNLAVMAENSDYNEAKTLYEQSLAIRRELGDKRGIAATLGNIGVMAYELGDLGAASAMYEDCLTIGRELGDKDCIGMSLFRLGLVSLEEGNLFSANMLFGQSLAIFRELGDRWFTAWALYRLGLVATRQGDYRTARLLNLEGMAIRQEMASNSGICHSLDSLASLAAAEGRMERAAQLWGATEALRAEIGASRVRYERDKYDREINAAREALGAETFTAAWDRGHAMTMEEAIELALQSPS
jgi:tetratricopeptide (TPR) repeat protein